MSFGAHWVQTHGKSFILLVGNKIDFGAEKLSNQGTGIVEAFDLLAGKLRNFGPTAGVVAVCAGGYDQYPRLMQDLPVQSITMIIM